MKKKLFLHAGLNKTGSSALQSWLSNNSEELGLCGYYYPITESKSAKFEISSGNGTLFNKYLDDGSNEDAVFKSYFDTTMDNIIISKENFNFTENKINRLKLFCSNHNLDLKVVLYVRDIYGWAYSIYVQVVKRHSYVRSFEQFVLGLNDAIHITYASLLDEHIEDVDIIHYDAVKSDVASAFTKSVGVDYRQLQPMAKVKVNRTLTFDEINVVTFISSLAKTYNENGQNDAICQLASDFLVNTYKERESEVLLNKDLVATLESKFKPDIEKFNRKTGVGLKLFTEDTRSETVKSEQLNIDILFDVLKNIIKKIKGEWSIHLAAEMYNISASHGSELIFELTDSKDKFINAYVLRDAALFLESVDLKKSLRFMELAKKIKPSGKFISKKVSELTSKLSK